MSAHNNPAIKMALFTALVAMHIPGSVAGYTLAKQYTSANFFDEFDFFTGTDPTAGTVEYVDFETANSTGLAGVATKGNFSDLIYLGVDSQNVAPNGRQSTRVSSKDAFNRGLFIADIVHAPGGICGTWPAFWLLGEGTWPLSGEIDIFEGVNADEGNQITLHTGPDCTNTASGYQGTQLTSDCNSYQTRNNAGCGIQSNDSQTYGSVFNDNDGGVYATEWTDQSISIWFFPRDNIPQDIIQGQPSPDTSTWGAPQASFGGGCDIDQRFTNMQLIVDTTFCGDWAGEVWSTSSCSSKAATCSDYVINNPDAFVDAYWAFNSITVFEMG